METWIGIAGKQLLVLFFVVTGVSNLTQARIADHIERLVRLADRHTIIERGRVAWRGSSAELQADRGLWHRYLGV